MDELEHQPHKRSARNGNRRKTMMQDAGLHADAGMRNVVRGSMHAQAAEQGSDRPTNGERMPFVHPILCTLAGPATPFMQSLTYPVRLPFAGVEVPAAAICKVTASCGESRIISQQVTPVEERVELNRFEFSRLSF